MYRVLYVGCRIEQFCSEIDFSDIQIDEPESIQEAHRHASEIVVIDGACFSDAPLVHACQIKSQFNSVPRVWIYLAHPKIKEPLEACYKEGFDDVLETLDVLKLEVSLIKATLLFNQRSHHVEQLDLAQNMARTALSNGGELGTLIRLLTNLVGVDNYNDMGMELIDWFEGFQLKVCVQIRGNESEIFEYATNSIVQPIEVEILSKAKTGDRIVEFGKIYIFNEPSISILIKNMPLDDVDKLGRLKDHIAMIIHSCESIVENINLKNNKRSEKNSIISSGLDDFKQQVMHVNEEVFQYISSSKNQFKLLVDRMYSDLQGLDLTDNQHEQIVEMMEGYGQFDDDFEEINLDIESKLSMLEQRIRVALP